MKQTNRKFSAIGIDQAHEQCNKVVKTAGRATRILENENALVVWSNANPVIGDLLEKFPERYQTKTTSNEHHENTNAHKKRFRKDIDKLVASFGNFLNPFTIEGLTNISTHRVLSEEASKSVRMAKDIGEKQYQEFTEERLVQRTT